MPNSRQTSVMASPSRSRATKRRRSSITELAFHGIHTSHRTKAESVTHVSGTFCHLCLRPLTRIELNRHRPDPGILARAVAAGVVLWSDESKGLSLSIARMKAQFAASSAPTALVFVRFLRAAGQIAETSPARSTNHSANRHGSA